MRHGRNVTSIIVALDGRLYLPLGVTQLFDCQLVCERHKLTRQRGKCADSVRDSDVKAAPGWTHCPGAPALWAAAAFSPRNSASSQGIVGCARIEFPPIMLMGAAAIAENACRRLPEFRARTVQQTKVREKS